MFRMCYCAVLFRQYIAYLSEKRVNSMIKAIKMSMIRWIAVLVEMFDADDWIRRQRKKVDCFQLKYVCKQAPSSWIISIDWLFVSTRSYQLWDVLFVWLGCSCVCFFATIYGKRKQIFICSRRRFANCNQYRNNKKCTIDHFCLFVCRMTSNLDSGQVST